MTRYWKLSAEEQARQQARWREERDPARKPLYLEVLENGFADLLIGHGFTHAPTAKLPGHFILKTPEVTWRVILGPRGQEPDWVFRDVNSIELHGLDKVARHFHDKPLSGRLWTTGFRSHCDFTMQEAYYWTELNSWRLRNPDPTTWWEGLKRWVKGREPQVLPEPDDAPAIDRGTKYERPYWQAFPNQASAEVTEQVCRYWETYVLPSVTRYQTRRAALERDMNMPEGEVWPYLQLRDFDFFNGAVLAAVIFSLLLGDRPRANEILEHRKKWYQERQNQHELSLVAISNGETPQDIYFRSEAESKELLEDFKKYLAWIEEVEAKVAQWTASDFF